MTRIHSPNSPSSVDMHFAFHFKAGAGGGYAIGFRVNKQPVPCVRERLIDVARPQNISWQTCHLDAGWSPFEWFHLNSQHRARGAYTVTQDDIDDVRHALFDQPSYHNESQVDWSGVSPALTARLMLASLGINFFIAENEEERQASGDGYQGYLFGQVLRTSPAFLRQLCDIPALRGDGEKSFSGGTRDY